VIGECYLRRKEKKNAENDGTRGGTRRVVSVGKEKKM